MGSDIAKNGFIEEQLVCNDLNKRLGNRFGHFEKVKGVFKSDITNNNGINIQVKKFKSNCFGQVDKRSVDSWINQIPALKPIESYLKDLCEHPIDYSTKRVVKPYTRKKLTTECYTSPELRTVIDVLNNNTESILNIIFIGNQWKPKFLCGVEYKNKTRHRLICYKTARIIDYLKKCTFEIRKSGTVIQLGPCLSFQRKGGDTGKPSSNLLQMKLVFSKLLSMDIKRLIYLL